jgi:DNA mismatch repair protein MSH4
MNDRIGVINMHLAVDMSEQNKMVMIYKLARGFVQEEHYGLALARVVGLPPKVLEIAEKVSRELDAQAAAKKQSSKAHALAKRRRLVLGLKEQLVQARDSPMEGKVLLSWLRRLQEAFVERMEQIGNDAMTVDMDGAEEDTSSES